MLLVRHLDDQVMYLLKRRKLEGNDKCVRRASAV